MPVTRQGPSARARLVVRAGERVDVDVKGAGVKGDVLPSGEWPESFSMLNYEDLSKYYEGVLFKAEVCADLILFVLRNAIGLVDSELAISVSILLGSCWSCWTVT